MKDEALRGRADLACVEETGESTDFGRLLDICIVKHDKHVCAAELERHLLQLADARAATSLPARSEPVNATPWTRSSSIRLATCSREMYRLVHGALGRAGVANRRFEQRGAQRYDVGLLHQHRIADRDRRGNHADMS